MTAKKKVPPKASAKKGKGKKIDYGQGLKEPVESGIKGAKKSTACSGAVKFTEIGQRCRGYFDHYEVIKKKGTSDIIHLKDSDDNVFTLFSSAAMKKHIHENDIQEGQEVEFVFTDVVKLTGGKTFKVIEMFFAEV